MKNITYLLLFLLISLGHSTQQGASISGMVTSNSGEPLLSATVALYKNGVLLTGTLTDLNGKFQLLNLDTGTYQIEVAYVGMQTSRMDNIHLSEQEHKSILIKLNEGITLETITVTDYCIPLLQHNFDRSNATTGSIRGSRSHATNYYIDGIRITGANPPEHINYPNRVYPSPSSPSHTEDYDAIQENRFRRTRDEPLSTFSMDVDAASYTNIRRYLRNGHLPPKDAVRIEEMINYFEYDYPQPLGTDPVSITDQIGPCPWNTAHYLLQIGLASQKIDVDSLPPANLVFLIDVSGSMNTWNKLPLLKKAFRLLAQQIRFIDQVSIVVYAGAAGLVLPPTTGRQKELILAAIDRLESGGSTAGGAGLKLAYQTARNNFIGQGNNRVILATDGDFNVGLSSDAEMVRLIEKERESGVFLSVLCFGAGNYKDNKMQKLADAGNGNHFYIDQVEEAKRVFVQEFGSTLFTIAKDVKLQVEFNPSQVEGYRLIGYENRLLNHEDFDDDQKDAGDMGAGHTVTALYEIIPAGLTNDPSLAQTSKLRYQWRTPNTRSLMLEMATVKFRYKHPNQKTSQLFTHTIQPGIKPTQGVNQDFQWATIVSGFGLLLRDSEWKGHLTYTMLREYIAKSNIPKSDPFRNELLELIDLAATIQRSTAHQE